MFDGNLTIAAYTADLWDTACPILRILGPAQQTSTTVIKGSVPRESGLQVQLEPIAEADIILIQREFPRHIAHYEQVMEEARRHGRPVVYELDDLLLELSPQHIDWSYYRTARLPLLKAIVEADAVTTSTPGLYDYLRQFNAHVWLLPNYLNDQLWTLRPAAVLPERIPLVIGYMGGHTHASDLELVAPALLRVLERHKGKVVLRFFGKAEPPPELIGRDDVSQDRLYFPDYAEFARYFSTQVCDIFIAPLRDNLFNRCKSAIKFLEYSSTGAPGVYSRITPYEGMVNDQNGFFANASEEWEDALDQLIIDPALRSRLGYRAQQTVQNQWLLSNHALEWDQAYRSILHRGKDTAEKTIALQVIRKTQMWQDQNESLVQSEAIVQSEAVVRQDVQVCPLAMVVPRRDSVLTKVRNAMTWYMAAPIPRVVARLQKLRRELTIRIHGTG